MTDQTNTTQADDLCEIRNILAAITREEMGDSVRSRPGRR